MATGTGLPIPKEDTAQVAPTSIAHFDNARAWGSIAQAGATLEKAGASYLQMAEYQQSLGAHADIENRVRRTALDLQAQYPDDPRGFEAAWKGQTEGMLGEVDPNMVDFTRRTLDRHGTSVYGTVLHSRMSRDQALARERTTTLLADSSNEVVGAAMAGTLRSPDGALTVEKYHQQLQAGVASGLHSQEWADVHFDTTMSKAEGEIAAREGVGVYREKGFDEAVAHLRKNILENEQLQLKPNAKYQAFSRGLQAIRLAKAEDTDDRNAVVEISGDIRKRLTSNQYVDPREYEDTSRQLVKFGAAKEMHKLTVDWATYQATAPYRDGLSLREFRDAVGGLRSRALPTNVAGVVDDAATQAGVNPALLRTIAAIESGGRPNAVTGSYKGLFQLSDEEFRRYGGRNIMDPGENARVAALKLRDEIGNFRQQYGRDPSPTEIYLTHQQGEAGLAAHLANPNAPAWQNMASTGEGRQKGPAWARAAIWGNVPDDVKARYGSVDNITSAQFVQLWQRKVEGGNFNLPGGVPYSGEIAANVQKVFVEQSRKAWPQYEDMINRGKTLDEEDFASIRYAAALSGDSNWQNKVEALATANKIGQSIAPLPEGKRQAALDQTTAALRAGGLPAITVDTIEKSLDKQFQLQNKQIHESPVDFWVDGMKGTAPPPLDFSTPQAAAAGIAGRVSIARTVASQQETAPATPFRAADRAALAGAISAGDPARAAVALDALGSLPDEMLTPALHSPEIKAAVLGAARSAEGPRFDAAMKFMDRLWAKGPETTKALFGEETVHSMMTWQSNLRYMSPEQLAQERTQRADDPGVIKRREVNEKKGLEEARKHDFNDVVRQFDSSWWVTPGPLARAIGSQPNAPVDKDTRDALMADFENLYTRRYADTLDKDTALKQSVELLKTKWTASPVNGGRLMLNAPEQLRGPDGKPTYPQVDGSYNWMMKQIEADIATEVGKPMRSQSGLNPFETTNWSYTIVPDRQTQAEAQNGRAASYHVVVTDAATGRATTLGRRYAWQVPADVQLTENIRKQVDFEQQRARLTNPYLSISGEPKGIYTGGPAPRPVGAPAPVPAPEPIE